MQRYSMTLIAFMLILCFGVFFGVELATRGMERIQGPMASDGRMWSASEDRSSEHRTPADRSADTGAGRRGSVEPESPSGDTAEGLPDNGAHRRDRSSAPPVHHLNADSGVNRLGNEVGGLLQKMASGTIRAVVGLFDGIVQ